MYINIKTLQYPLTERDIRHNNPNVSYPSPFNPGEDYAVVFLTPQPPHNPVTQIVRATQPVLTSKGTWEQRWEIVSKFHEYTDEQGVIHTVAEQEIDAIAEDLNNKRQVKWEAIKAERDRRTQQGGYSASSKWFHSDTFSRSQQLGLVMLGNNIPAGLMWKTMDGTFIEMTPALAQEIFQAATISDSTIFAYAESLNQQVQSSDNPESIDIKSGWPICFLDI